MILSYLVSALTTDELCFVHCGVGRVVFRHRKQSDFEDAALEWLDEQHRDEVQRGLAQE